MVRFLVFVLSVSLASAGALPVWALFAGVEAAHVCHCAVEKHDCVCAKCNPEHEDRLTTESLRGRCGDDEAAFIGKAIVGVLSSPVGSIVIAAAMDGESGLTPTPRPVVIAARAPPTPPPRSFSSRTV